MVHLFQTAAIGFGYAEEDPDAGEDTESGEENIGAVVVGSGDQRWGYETDDTVIVLVNCWKEEGRTVDEQVIQPIRAGREGDTLGSE